MKNAPTRMNGIASYRADMHALGKILDDLVLIGFTEPWIFNHCFPNKKIDLFKRFIGDQFSIDIFRGGEDYSLITFKDILSVEQLKSFMAFYLPITLFQKYSPNLGDKQISYYYSGSKLNGYLLDQSKLKSEIFIQTYGLTDNLALVREHLYDKETRSYYPDFWKGFEYNNTNAVLENDYSIDDFYQNADIDKNDALDIYKDIGSSYLGTNKIIESYLIINASYYKNNNYFAFNTLVKGLATDYKINGTFKCRIRFIYVPTGQEYFDTYTHTYTNDIDKLSENYVYEDELFDMPDYGENYDFKVYSIKIKIDFYNFTCKYEQKETADSEYIVFYEGKYEYVDTDNYGINGIANFIDTQSSIQETITKLNDNKQFNIYMYDDYLNYFNGLKKGTAELIEFNQSGYSKAKIDDKEVDCFIDSQCVVGETYNYLNLDIRPCYIKILSGDNIGVHKIILGLNRYFNINNEDYFIVNKDTYWFDMSIVKPNRNYVLYNHSDTAYDLNKTYYVLYEDIYGIPLPAIKDNNDNLFLAYEDDNIWICSEINETVYLGARAYVEYKNIYHDEYLGADQNKFYEGRYSEKQYQYIDGSWKFMDVEGGIERFYYWKDDIITVPFLYPEETLTYKLYSGV